LGKVLFVLSSIGLKNLSLKTKSALLGWEFKDIHSGTLEGSLQKTMFAMKRLDKLQNMRPTIEKTTTSKIQLPKGITI
jgi:hypothetical protein